MSNIIIRKIFEELTFFGGIAFFMFLVVLFWLFEKTDILIKLILGLILIYAITFVIRLFYFKPRPKRIGYKNYLEKIDASSFPSVHAARAIFLCFSIILAFNLNWILNSFVILLAILVIYSRIYLLKHDIVDAIGGILLGLLSLNVFILV
jgi:undecaprenyl-diphosphatase